MENLSPSLDSPRDSWYYMFYGYEIILFTPWSYCIQVYFVLKNFPGSLISASNDFFWSWNTYPLNTLNLTKWTIKPLQSFVRCTYCDSNIIYLTTQPKNVWVRSKVKIKVCSKLKIKKSKWLQCRHSCVFIFTLYNIPHTAQKMKFSINDFFSKSDQICKKLRIWWHLLKKSLMENFIFVLRHLFLVFLFVTLNKLTGIQL